MLPTFLEIIIISGVSILLAGEAIAILNIYRLSNPIKNMFTNENSKEHGLTYEERAFLLHDLELQKRLADHEEQRIASGEIIGSISECRSRKNLLQALIIKIKGRPLYYQWGRTEVDG